MKFDRTLARRLSTASELELLVASTGTALKAPARARPRRKPAGRVQSRARRAQARRDARR